MSYEQLHNLAIRTGLLLDDKPTMPVLKLRIKRSAM